jgi:uncharacterized protein (TIGR02186 family)
MIRRLLAISALILAIALPARAEEVVAGLSQNRVAITASFDGSEILVFGAVKREAPAPLDPSLEVIVAVSGPSTPITLRKKSRRLGIWINTQALEIDAAPSFYSVSTSAPLRDILNHTDDIRHGISIGRVIRSVGAPEEIKNAARFTEALVRIRTENRLYQLNEGSVDLAEDTLFRTSVALPSNLTEGAFTARIFLTPIRPILRCAKLGWSGGSLPSLMSKRFFMGCCRW